MFSGKVVAVTGAKGGIGRAFAEMFIKDGAKVAISDIADPEETAEDIGAIGTICDVSDEASVKAFIRFTEDRLGPVDCYISNAGLGFSDAAGGHAAGATNEQWQTSWDVNVMGSVYAARDLIPKMRSRGSGNFVIVASAAGLLTQIGSASYSAAKHAAVGFAENMAIMHAADGISVQCVCPQYVRTDMTKDMKIANARPDELLEPSDVAQALRSAIADNRFMVLPHEVIGAYFSGKAQDYDGWIKSMVQLKAKYDAANLSF